METLHSQYMGRAGEEGKGVMGRERGEEGEGEGDGEGRGEGERKGREAMEREGKGGKRGKGGPCPKDPFPHNCC